MIEGKQMQRPQLVLVVDDQELNRDAIGVILEDDYDLIFAENGQEALALMRSSEFMQVVTDTVKQTSTAVATSVANSMGNAARSTVESAKSAFSSIWHHADS